MSKTTFELPENHREIYSLNLQKDRKAALKVNGAAIIITILLVAAGIAARPGAFGAALDTFVQSIQSRRFHIPVFMLLGLTAGQFAYIVLHELVHGIFIRLFSGKKADYGFTGIYAFASGEAYFSKRDYIIIALAPVIIWGIVLVAACCTVPEHWFWIIYLIQITNLSGAAGDFYVTLKFSAMPPDILVKDAGVSMKVYSAE